MKLAGKGLHTGEPTEWEVTPSQGGLSFETEFDLQPMGQNAARVAVGQLATDVGAIRTLEHVLAACVGLDMAAHFTHISGVCELPSLGGCAPAFSFKAPPLPRFCPPHIVRVEDAEGGFAQWEPGTGLEIRYSIAFPTVLGEQTLDVELGSPGAFERQIQRARTFTWAPSMALVHQARQRGVGAGLEDDEGLVFGPTSLLHGELRWDDEPVRHKVLDLIGDLGLLGIRPQGRLVVHRGGHRLHRALARLATAYLE